MSDKEKKDRGNRRQLGSETGNNSRGRRNYRGRGHDESRRIRHFEQNPRHNQHERTDQDDCVLDTEVTMGRCRRGRRSHCQPVTSMQAGASPSFGFGFLTKDIIMQLANSDSNDILLGVAKNEDALKKAYKYEKYCSHPVVLKNLIKILYKLVECAEYEHPARILAVIMSPAGEYAFFLFQLKKLIQNMTSETRDYIKAENEQYLGYLVTIGIFIADRIPTSVMVFPHHELNCTIQEISNSSQIRKRMEELELKIKQLREQHSKMNADMDMKIQASIDPPEDFREVNILPNASELNKPKTPFLRKNIVVGSYNNWDHYLDVQFRLLREDFMGPLRTAIWKIYNGEKSRVVGVYDHIHILDPVCLPGGCGYQLSFDTTPFHSVSWEYSKRLIFGSLLCLSCDNFETIIFATVSKRDPAQLKKGIVSVTFEGQFTDQMLVSETEYTMVESTAYFEAYRHVLEGLQVINPTTIPFKAYFVDYKQERVPPPCYLKAGISPNFNLKNVLDMNSIQTVSVLDPKTWPSHNDTCLDCSQLEALQVALGREVSLIQGPPGTGKTHIGLKIVEALLLNRPEWDPRRTSPILVLCYTNHALDQFLEGITRFKINGDKPRIARIGGRSKNQILNECILGNLVHQCQVDRGFPGILHENWIKSKKNLDVSKKNFESQLHLIQNTYSRVLECSELSDAISEVHMNQLCKQNVPGKEISNWLGLWQPFDVDLGKAEYNNASVDDDDDDRASDDEVVVSVQENDGSGEDLVDVDQEACLLEDDRMSDIQDLDFRPNLSTNMHNNTKSNKDHVNQYKWTVVQLSQPKKKRRFKNGLKNRPMTEEEVAAVIDLQLLPDLQRWMLYLYWVERYRKLQYQTLSKFTSIYDQCCKEHLLIQQKRNIHVLRDIDIIGMTSTGASKHHYLFGNISPKIMIVEEAAEVFEAHIVAALSSSVQQLVMIGDHKQLRPNSNNYELEKHYDFNVSLFERLINNKVPYVTLEVQHRMRPEIACLISPHIYKNLKNSDEVQKYEHVKGIGKDVFFIDHHVYEEQRNRDEMYSHINTHEARYLVQLCHHLLKQGYKPNQITMLTMYRGQLLEMRRYMKRSDFTGVRVAVVDDFQGEENDIILLSLVRSNPEGNIGFLKTSNRICVSLSRAKIGFYVIGNLSMLRAKDDTEWPMILTDMERRQHVGEALSLYCQTHTETTCLARTPEDFSKFPEGGCTLACNQRLRCGHRCTRLCHPYDSEHKEYNCQKECCKKLPCGHQCRSKCYICAKGCPPCSVPVTVNVSCGHTLILKCGDDHTDASCNERCTTLLQCGHQCKQRCSEPCTKLCEEHVVKTLRCGHTLHSVKCYLKAEDHLNECNEPCKATLSCGHACTGKCSDCHNGRIHKKCSYNCGRTQLCGHLCKFPCTNSCPPCNEPCENHCAHSKCPKKCYELCVKCTEPCLWKCTHFKCRKRCGELCDRPRCNEPCKELLDCGHPCIGLCGEQCPDKCRLCNRKTVTELFFGGEEEEDAMFIQLEDCKHIFEFRGLDKWMDTEIDGQIQFKSCPRCKKIIRRHLRYGNIVKKVLQDMQCIKKKQHANVDDICLQISVAVSTLETSKNRSVVALKQRLQKTLNNLQLQPSPLHLNSAQNQLAFIPEIAKLFDILEQTRCEQLVCGSCIIGIKQLHNELVGLQECIMQSVIFPQELQDINCEFQRVRCVIQLCDLWLKTQAKQIRIQNEDQQLLFMSITMAHNSGLGTLARLTDDNQIQIKEVITRLTTTYGIGQTTDAERVEIVKAIGLPKGHWFKCPKGHFYCIGECGGAMQVSTCPECGAKIGGNNHTLTSGNELAGEIDGAKYAAWSDAANMANYDMRD